MRHEEATAAIYTVRSWFGGRPSDGSVDGKVANLIAALLEAKQLSDSIHDSGKGQEEPQRVSVDLLWAIERACDFEAIQKAISTAREYAKEMETREAGA